MVLSGNLIRKANFVLLLATLFWGGGRLCQHVHAAEQENGLAATFTVGEQSDSTILSNVWLYVPANEPATPFVPPGKFQTVWRGFVSVDLRSDFTFTALLNGALKVEVNGAVALEGATNNALIKAPKAVRLNKG